MAAAGTFRGFVAEGTRLSRRGEHGKALACFQRALTLRAGDKDCLVACSECYRRLGDLDNALKDAEASLENDKMFAKGLYQKAETLYTMGDFEFALVFYHRGNKVRPDQQKFRLGIQKSEEAILNGIASLSSLKLENKEDVCFLSRQAESKNTNEKPQMKPTEDQKDQKLSKKQEPVTKDQKWTRKGEPVRNPKIERQLLGELYADKVFLEKLLKDKDLMESRTKQGTKVADLVLSGLSYLDTRREFWQQQNPISARVRERELRQQRRIRAKKKIAAEVCRYIAKSMKEIEMLLSGGFPEESCKKAERVLKTIQGWSGDEVPSKNELIGNLHSCIGSARLEMGQAEAALRSHKTDLEIARQNNLPDAESRALGNIGRVYASIGKFQQAIDSWEEKIPMAKSSLEKTWLFHEIGRCYLELNKAEEARGYGQKSLRSAGEGGDAEWQLHATVLVAQAQVKLKDYRAAITSFEKALEKAKQVCNGAAQAAILGALDDVSKSFIKELNKRREETTVDSLRVCDSSRENTEGGNNSENYREKEGSEQSAENQDEEQGDARSCKEGDGNDKDKGKEQETKENWSEGEKRSAERMKQHLRPVAAAHQPLLRKRKGLPHLHPPTTLQEGRGHT